MKISCASFIEPKKGEANEQCQDSLFPSPEGTSADCFAVADGATESFESRRWARCLTSQFGSQTNAAFAHWAEWLKQCQDSWYTEVEMVARSPEASDYTVNDFNGRRSAASTFVGLQLNADSRPGSISWRALIVGDSCLFHLRSDGKPISYLLKSPRQFDANTPAVISYPIKNPSDPELIQSEAEEGDAFILATDAFSKWLLTQQEKKTPVWGPLLGWNTGDQEIFRHLVADARASEACSLDDDDVALLVVRLGEPHAIYKTHTLSIPNQDRGSTREGQVQELIRHLGEARQRNAQLEARIVELKSVAPSLASFSLAELQAEVKMRLADRPVRFFGLSKSTTLILITLFLLLDLAGGFWIFQNWSRLTNPGLEPETAAPQPHPDVKAPSTTPGKPAAPADPPPAVPAPKSTTLSPGDPNQSMAQTGSVPEHKP